jgi:carotenoid 1,2-hydratase
VFSPYYAWARRRGGGDPLQHCALNVSLYGKPRGWTLTERGSAAVQRDPEMLRIGPSALTWDGTGLTVRIDEITAPLPSRIRGVVRVLPSALTSCRFSLDQAGRHRWSPLAPTARVEVRLEQPALRWSGDGYLDSNDGDAPLEEDFVEWDWSRAPLPGGATVLYNVTRRTGPDLAMALRFDRAGQVEHFPPPPRASLAPTLWRMPRRTRCDEGAQAVVRQTLQDAPFYARSVIETRIAGEQVTAMHESLSLDRFRQLWVQAMLPFRIPRRLGAARPVGSG